MTIGNPPKRPVVGWIGAGRIGRPMVERVLCHGYSVLLCELREDVRRALAERGAEPAASAKACAAAADFLFCSMPNDAALDGVLLGTGGVLAEARPGLVLVETSTISPALSARISAEAEARHVAYLRLPVSGNPDLAAQGRLTALVSGPEDAWARARPIVETFTAAQRYVGSGKEARILKLVINLIVANMAPILAEGLTLGRKGGLDWRVMIDTIGASPLASPWLHNKLGALAARDFSATFPPRMILKDLDLMLDAARECGVPLPVTALTRQLIQGAALGEFADEDYFVLVKSLERQAGLADVIGRGESP